MASSMILLRVAGEEVREVLHRMGSDCRGRGATLHRLGMEWVLLGLLRGGRVARVRVAGAG